MPHSFYQLPTLCDAPRIDPSHLGQGCSWFCATYLGGAQPEPAPIILIIWSFQEHLEIIDDPA